MTPWMAVTLVSSSSTSAPIDTFMTVASTVIKNWVTARMGSTPAAGRVVDEALMPRSLAFARRPASDPDVPRQGDEHRRRADEEHDAEGRRDAGGVPPGHLRRDAGEEQHRRVEHRGEHEVVAALVVLVAAIGGRLGFGEQPVGLERG